MAYREESKDIRDRVNDAITRMQDAAQNARDLAAQIRRDAGLAPDTQPGSEAKYPGPVQEAAEYRVKRAAKEARERAATAADNELPDVEIPDNQTRDPKGYGQPAISAIDAKLAMDRRTADAWKKTPSRHDRSRR